MKPVTDPTILEQLEGTPGLKPVTDPSVLEQLNAPDEPKRVPGLIERLFSGGAAGAASDPMGTGASDIMAVAKPAPVSVLESLPPDPAAFNFRTAGAVRRKLDAGLPPAPRVPSEASPSTPVDSGFVENAARIARKVLGSINSGTAGVVRAVGDVTGMDGVADFARASGHAGQRFANKTEAGKTSIEGFTPGSVVQGLPRALEDAAVSIGSQIPALATGSLPASLAVMGLQSGGMQYGEVRDKGMDVLPALVNAALTGGAEVIGERVGGTPGTIRALKGALAGNAPARVAAEMARAGIRDIPGEELTTALQYATDAAPGIGSNPNPSMGEYIDQAKKTLVQTVLQGGMMTGGGAALARGAQMLSGAPAPTTAPSRERDLSTADASDVPATDPVPTATPADPPSETKGAPGEFSPDTRAAGKPLAARLTELATAERARGNAERASMLEGMAQEAEQAAQNPDLVKNLLGETVAARTEQPASNDVTPAATVAPAAGRASEVNLPASSSTTIEDVSSPDTQLQRAQEAIDSVAKSAENNNLSSTTQNVQNTPPAAPGAPAAETTPAQAARTQAVDAGAAPAAGQATAGTSAGAGAVEATGVENAQLAQNRKLDADQQAPSNTEAAAPQQIGRNNIPLTEGGKPFKTRKAAADAKKLQPTMRVVSVDGGFVLAPKTPAQLAAQEKASRRMAVPQTSPRGEPIPAHAFIAAAGGLASSNRADMAMQGNIRIGNRSLFAGAGKGLTIERATEKLIEEGYLPENASHEQARTLIKRSLQTPQYNTEGTERMAEADAERRFEAAMQDDAVESVQELDENELDAVLEQYWEDPQSNVSTESAMRSLGFSEEEIQDAIANESREPQENRTHDGDVGQTVAGKTQGDSGSRDQTARDATQNTQPGGTTEGLTSYTPQEVVARQDQQEQDRKASAAREVQAEQDAKKERDAKDVASRQQASAENFQLGQSADDSLSGQQSIFEPGSNYGQTDLFADAVPNNQRTSLVERSAAAGSRSGPEKAITDRANSSTLPGEYATVVELRPVKTGKIGLEVVTSADDAAHAMASLTDLAREHFDVLVLGKGGKILAIQRMFAGAKTQTSVHPAEIVAFVNSVPGAESFYAAHNHPSGNPTFSNADLKMTESIVATADGVAPAFKGLFALAGGRYSLTEYGEPGVSGLIPSLPMTKTARYVEQVILKSDTLGEPVTSPQEARIAVGHIAKGRSGIVLTNAQMTPVAFFPIDFAVAEKLDSTMLARDVLSAVARSNASGALLATGDYGSDSGILNVGTLLARADVQVLDAFGNRELKNPNLISRAEKGLNTKRSFLLSRSESDSGNTAESVRAALTARFGPMIARMEKRGFLKIWDGTEQFNESGQHSSKIEGAAQGGWDGKTAHLFADGIPAGYEVAVLLHEVGEHASMPQMLGQKGYKQLVARARALVHGNDPTALAAVARIPDDTKAQFLDSELLAYMIETVAAQDAKASPGARKWLADVVAAIRAWWSTTALAVKLQDYGVKLELTPKDIAALAVRAVKWQGQQQRVEGIQEVEVVFSQAPVTSTAAFRRWFGDSKVVAPDGLPLVVYHATNRDFTAFDPSAESDFDYDGQSSGGLFFTSDPDYAGYYASGSGGQIMPVYLSLQNPARLPANLPLPAQASRLREAKDAGHDGAILGDGEFVVFESGQVKSATGNNGRFDRANPDIRFSRPGGPPPTNAAASGTLAPSPWNVSQPGAGDAFIRAIQNNKIDVKRVRDAIAEQYGPVTDSKDAYLGEELYQGKVGARVDALYTEQIEPILKKIAIAGKNVGVTVDDVNLYLHARHAPERNAAMQTINPDMANNTALSGMSDAEAATVMADFAAAGKTAALAIIAQDIDQLTSDTRTGLVADGLEDAAVVQAWEQAYQHYVPLQRDIKSSGTPKGMGFSVRGPESKRAVGSNREVVNILANIVAQAETAAIRAEKAVVGRTLLDMARQYPNPNFWEVDVAPTKPRIDPQTGLVIRGAIDPMYQTADNVVMVKDYGAEHFIVFNKDNERAMQMARAMKNLDIAPMNKILQVASKGTRFIASLLTQRNPLFWMTNFARDIQGALVNLTGTDAEGLQAKVLGNLPKAFKGMHALVRGDGTGQWASYAKEMQEAGGTTGYMQQFENSDARMDDLKKEVARMGQGKADPRRLARLMLDFVDDYNDIIENAVRLSVFQAARQAGVSTAKAASLGKNITVNFNRKGNLTPPVNALYMFFNASVQGTARMAQGLATSKTAWGIVGGIAAMGFVLDALNRLAGGDDDETGRNRYELIPEFDKSKNWIFMNPKRPGEYVKVPLPLGPHIFHNAGRLISDAVFRKNPRNASEYGWSMASTLMDAFSPLGTTSSFGQLIAPSVLDPVLQLTENKSFTGAPVYKSAENGFGKKDPKPAYTRHFESTPDVWKGASKLLNDVSGGDAIKPGKINIEPDILKHVFYTMTGGPGRTVDQALDSMQSQARGVTPSVNRVPFVSRFYGANDDRQRERVYYDDRKRILDAKTQFDYFNKNGRPELAKEVATELSGGDPAKGRRMMLEHASASKGVSRINKSIRAELEREESGSDRGEQVKALKQRRSKAMARAVQEEDPEAD